MPASFAGIAVFHVSSGEAWMAGNESGHDAFSSSFEKIPAAS
jgi:hypothetical protein